MISLYTKDKSVNLLLLITCGWCLLQSCNNTPRSKEQVEYDNTGKIKARYILDENGKRNGLAVTYYPSGNIRSRELYSNDTLTGEAEYFYANGKYHEKSHYLDGSLDGVKEIYYESGTVCQRQTYMQGKLHGPDYLFDKAGHIAQYQFFVIDQFIFQRTYFKNGSSDSGDLFDIPAINFKKMAFQKPDTFKFTWFQATPPDLKIYSYASFMPIDQHFKWDTFYGNEIHFIRPLKDMDPGVYRFKLETDLQEKDGKMHDRLRVIDTVFTIK